MTTRWVLSAALAILLNGCATTQPEPKATSGYPGRCELIGLEQKELPTDQSSDQVALVATYRFGSPSRPRSKPVVFAFQVTRERADDIRAHIIANASVLCQPDEGANAIALPPSETYGAIEPMPAAQNPWPIERLPERRDRKVHMGHTFWDAVDARDALIDGDLKAAQAAARALRDRAYGDTLPAEWKPFISDMRKHANDLAMAPDVEVAATELGMIALSCGNCHWLADHGPDPLPDARVIEPQPGEEQLRERMLRHVIASEQMWEGLIIPSDHTWHQGTLAFTHAPLAPPVDEGMAVDSSAHALIEELRPLAAKARVVTSRKERAQLYGQLVARCAACHSARP